MPSLMVCIPSFDRSLKGECAESVGNAIEHAEGLGLLSRVVHRYPKGYSIARARNFMAQWALDEEVDLLWMVDSDMVVPEDGLALLLEDMEGIGLAMGWYIRGTSETDTCAIRPGSPGYSASYKAIELRELSAIDGYRLVPVKSNGLGCALMKTHLFKSLKRPWFVYQENADGTALGEDYYFCKQLAGIGVSAYVDTRVHCGHIHDRVLEAR